MTKCNVNVTRVADYVLLFEVKVFLLLFLVVEHFLSSSSFTPRAFSGVTSGFSTSVSKYRQIHTAAGRGNGYRFDFPLRVNVYTTTAR